MSSRDKNLGKNSQGTSLGMSKKEMIVVMKMMSGMMMVTRLWRTPGIEGKMKGRWGPESEEGCIQRMIADIVIKTKENNSLLDDLKETFDNLRKFRMKLNPTKYKFAVQSGKLLGFLVSRRGIEANSAKIKAIERMELPKKLKDVQKFTGCLASLSRFVSRLGEKALPLYQLMKKSDRFV